VRRLGIADRYSRIRPEPALSRWRETKLSSVSFLSRDFWRAQSTGAHAVVPAQAVPRASVKPRMTRMRWRIGDDR
jgi:hypothetical protein